MKRGGPNHPKTFSLAESLGIRRAHAVGILEMLFHFAAEFAPQGDVGKYADKRIAGALDWAGSPAKLISALVENGWLDPHPGCRLVVHDWSEHADRTTLQKLSRNGKSPIQSNHEDTEILCTQSELKIRALPQPEPQPEPEPTTTAAKLLPLLPQLLKPDSRRRANFLETHSAVREFFPTADEKFIGKLASKVHEICSDASDSEIAEAVRGSWVRGKQQSAGLFLNTVPAFVLSVRAGARASPKPQVSENTSLERVEELWDRATPEDRFKIEEMWPELRVKRKAN